MDNGIHIEPFSRYCKKVLLRTPLRVVEVADTKAIYVRADAHVSLTGFVAITH